MVGNSQEIGSAQVRELSEAVQRLSLASSLAQVQEIVGRAARALVGADGATFVLREDDRCFYAAEDAISPLWQGRRFPMASCVSGWTMLNHRPAAVEDVFEDDRVLAGAYEPTFVRSLLMVPIRTLDPIGAVGMYWGQRHSATESETLIAQALADCTAVAIAALQLRNRLDDAVHLAETDALTSLPNRRVWDERLERLPIGSGSLGLLDVDHFKFFNDVHGHDAGDRMLRTAARAWRDVLRPGDLLARVGGEEFGLILHDCPLDRGLEIAERVRRATPDGITASLGVAQWSGHPHAAMLLQRADAALYAAKAGGRDRTRAATVVS